MRNTLVTIAGTTLVPILLHVLVPCAILQSTSALALPELGPIQWASIILAVVSLSVVVWVSTTFVTRGKGTAAPVLPPKEFVAVGLYRYVRNPMYVGLLLVIIAESAFFRSAWLLLYAFLLWLATHGYVVLIEEPQLEKRFGDTYRRYRESTPRWIPRPPRHLGA